jgi:hypothetical protein
VADGRIAMRKRCPPRLKSAASNGGVARVHDAHAGLLRVRDSSERSMFLVSMLAIARASVLLDARAHLL